MNIVIIGGSGFVGTRLVARLLDKKHSITILDKNKSNKYPELWKYCDVRQPETLDTAFNNTDIVINLAAEHRDDVTPKTLYDEVNVAGAENVCNACKKQGVTRLIFTSSVAVYGFASPGTDENGEIHYFNDYGRTKWLAEGKYRDWLKENKKNSLTIIRPTVIFGEQNRGNVYNLLKQIASGFFPMIGNGKNVKSMAYVENVCAFIEHNLENSPGEHLFNYIDKPDFDMNTLVSTVYKALGRNKKIIHWPYVIGMFGGYCFDILAFLTRKKLPISSIRVKKFCSTTMFNANALQKTGFVPPVTLEEGLTRTIQYEFVDKVQDHVFITE